MNLNERLMGVCLGVCVCVSMSVFVPAANSLSPSFTTRVCVCGNFPPTELFPRFSRYLENLFFNLYRDKKIDISGKVVGGINGRDEKPFSIIAKASPVASIRAFVESQRFNESERASFANEDKFSPKLLFFRLLREIIYWHLTLLFLKCAR